MRRFYFDTETFPIRAGLSSPKMVCLQYAYDEEEPKVVLRKDAEPILREALTNRQVLIEAHNIMYDLGVIAVSFPNLVGPLFNALSEGRGRDTLLREKLFKIEDGSLQDGKGGLSLADLAKAKLNIVVPKGEETWRLRYALLDDVPVNEWPEDALKYAIDDVLVLREVSKHQRSFKEPPDEWLHVAAAFALQLASINGPRTDAGRIYLAEEKFKEQVAVAEKALLDSGLAVLKDGEVTVKKAAKQEAVRKACEQAGREVPRTEKGEISTTADLLEELSSYNNVLTMISQLTTANKMLTSYLSALKVGTKYAMTSNPNPLVASGRTSWSGSNMKIVNPFWDDKPRESVSERVGTNLQNFPQMPGLRECVVPRPGYVFASVDYGSLELRTLAQANLWLFGHSTMAKGFQNDADYDPHSYFGGVLIGINYEEALRRKKSDPTFKNGPRKIGKALNFSLPGFVGAKRFSAMSLDLYKAGDLPAPISLEEAYDYRYKYLVAYPEMREFFDYISYIANVGIPLKQFVSNRLRKSNNAAALANSVFQGLAADLAKRALFYVSKSCFVLPNSPLFGSRVFSFIHDELLVEIPEEKAHEAAEEIVRLMVLAAQEVCPDIPFTAEPALMRAWIKKAEPQYDNGRLVPWKCKKCGSAFGCDC